MALKVGTESKGKTYAAIGLAALMLVLLVRFVLQNFGPSSPAPAPTVVSAPARPAPAATTRTTPAEAPYAHAATLVASNSALDPTLHPEVMRQAESLEYTGRGRNIFSQFSTPDIPQPGASARNTQPAAPTGPPPPPPIDLRFYGYSSQNGGKKQIFLLHGDDIFIASQGDVVNRRYRVASISPMSVQIEDIPFHNTQTLPLQQ